MLWISETALPAASAAARYTVSPPAAWAGVGRCARSRLIAAARARQWASDSRSATGTGTRSGSAIHASRSMNACLAASTIRW